MKDRQGHISKGKKVSSGKGGIPRLRFPEFRDAGGWSQKKLNQAVISISNGLNLNQINDSAGFKVTRIETISDQTIDLNKVGFIRTDQDISQYRLNIGDILFSNINSLDHIGKSVIVDQDYDLYHGMNLLRLVVEVGAYNYNFIFYLLNTETVKASIKARANKAVNQASINQTELGQTIIVAPKRSEQQKIADCLSSIDELITAETQKLDTLKGHKKGLMQQLFPAQGETVPKIRFPEFRNVGEWETKKFGSLLKISSGKGFKASEYSDAGIRLLQIENVGYGNIKWNKNTSYLPDDYIQQYSELVLREGDIVLALNRPITNSELKIAKLKKYDEPSILYQRVGKIEKISDLITEKFIFQLCRKNIKEFVIKQSIGSDQPFISLRTLYDQVLSIPSHPEQQKIATCLSSLDDLITAQTQKIDALKSHKKGLMQQLFPALDEVQR